jgi:RNA polymerase sigma-70 factor (ECF subfamily)
MTGNDAAFSELVARRRKPLRDLLRRLCGDHALADDLAQQALVFAWRRLGQLADADAFGGWLRRIAVNVWLDETRRGGPRLEQAEAWLDAPDPAPSPERAALNGLELERALATLKPEERLCVALAHGEGLTHPEIAETTGLPLGTVKSHVLRGSEKLRRKLGMVRGDE